MDSQRKCTNEDLTVSGYSEQKYTVNENFEADELLEDTGLERIESVDCDNCGEWWDTIEDAKEHIEEQNEDSNT